MPSRASSAAGLQESSQRDPLKQPEESGVLLWDSVVQERDALLSIAMQSPALSLAKRESLRAMLQAPEFLLKDEASQGELVESLYALGRHPEGMQADTGLIQATCVLHVLAAALSSKHEPVATRALTYLLDYAPSAALAPVAETVRKALERNPLPGSNRLRGLLPLSPKERAMLLEAELDDLALRARLGDTPSETQILANFRSATDYATKRSAAKALGYAGTSKCTKALLAAMGSELANRTPYFERSIRCDLIEQLARIEPEQELFTLEYQQIQSVGQDEYGQQKTEDYLGRITDWGQRMHQVPRASLAEGALLVRKLIVKRPLKRPL